MLWSIRLFTLAAASLSWLSFPNVRIWFSALLSRRRKIGAWLWQIIYSRRMLMYWCYAKSVGIFFSTFNAGHVMFIAILRSMLLELIMFSVREVYCWGAYALDFIFHVMLVFTSVTVTNTSHKRYISILLSTLLNLLIMLLALKSLKDAASPELIFHNGFVGTWVRTIISSCVILIYIHCLILL